MIRLGMGVGLGGSAIAPIVEVQVQEPVGGLFSDNFNRADGGLGANWEVLNGSWSIVSNRAVPTTASNFNTAVHDVGQANVIIRAKIKTTTTPDSVGMIVFRTLDATHHLFVEVKPTAINMFLMNTGQTTLFTNPLTTYVDFGEVRLELDGDFISVYYEDVFQYTVENSYLNVRTKHGMGSWSTGGAEIEDFIIEALP